MKKALRWIIPLLLALVIAAGALFLLWPKQAAAPTTPEAAQPVYTMLYERDVSRFTRMTVTAKGYEPYTVKNDCVYDENGTLLGVKNSLAQPILLEQRESFPFHSYGYQMVMLLAEHLPITRTLPEAGNLSDYGLTQPDVTLTIEYEGEAPLRIAIGSLTPGGDGCYLTMNGETTVHIAPSDLYVTFSEGINLMHRAVASLGFDASSVTAVTIEQKGYVPVEIAKKAGDANIVPFEMLSPVQHDVSSERLRDTLSLLCQALPSQFAGYAVTQEETAAYGLDEPAARFTLVISDQYLAQITIGDDCEGGMAYMTVDRSGEVYQVSKEKLGFLNHATSDELLDQYVALVDAAKLASLNIVAGEKTRDIRLSWDENDPEKVYPKEYLLDGASLSQEAFTRVYQQLIGLMFDKLAPQAALAAAPKLSLDFAMRDGTHTQISYCPYDGYYDLVQKDGQACFLIRSEKVDATIAQLP